MVKHHLHILIAETKVEDALGTLDLLLDLLLVKKLDVVVKLLNLDLVEVDFLGNLEKDW